MKMKVFDVSMEMKDIGTGEINLIMNFNNEFVDGVGKDKIDLIAKSELGTNLNKAIKDFMMVLENSMMA
jgi:hypothetical protein